MLRILFLNEGNLGSNVMGLSRVRASLDAGLPKHHDVEAHHITLPPMGRPSRIATHHLPLLSPLDLDFGATRWHLAQAVRSKRALRHALQKLNPHAIHITSHSIAFGLKREMRQWPTYLSLDATVAQWSAMGIWRPVRAYSDAMLAPSRALERRALNEAATVLAWTPWAAEGARKASSLADVIEHHPGLDLRRFRPAPRSERREQRILFVGGRFSEKGGYDLLAAAGPLLAEGRVVVDLVTPARVAEQPGVRVHALSPDDEALLALYQQADVFCLPTKGDTMGWANVEAMACATPVISTRVGGIPDVLGHGTSGMLIEPGDVRALRAAIEALLADESKRRAFGAAARARCEQRYDAVEQTDALVQLIGRRTGHQ